MRFVMLLHRLATRHWQTVPSGNVLFASVPFQLPSPFLKASFHAHIIDNNQSSPSTSSRCVHATELPYSVEISTQPGASRRFVHSTYCSWCLRGGSLGFFFALVIPWTCGVFCAGAEGKMRGESISLLNLRSARLGFCRDLFLCRSWYSLWLEPIVVADLGHKEMRPEPTNKTCVVEQRENM